MILTSGFFNKWIVTGDSTISKDLLLQMVTDDFGTCKKQRVNLYAYDTNIQESTSSQNTRTPLKMRFSK